MPKHPGQQIGHRDADHEKNGQTVIPFNLNNYESADAAAPQRGPCLRLREVPLRLHPAPVASDGLCADSVQCRLLALSGQFSRTRICLLLDKSGQRWILASNGLSAFDPTATFAVHCGNRFDAGFSPYQSTRLSR
jgi:hypothetical protein